MLEGPLFAQFFEKVEVTNFEVASDAFATFKDLLTRHKALVARFLASHYDEVGARFYVCAHFAVGSQYIRVGFLTLMNTSSIYSRLLPYGLIAHVRYVPSGNAFSYSAALVCLLQRECVRYHVACKSSVCNYIVWIVWRAVFRTVHTTAAVHELCHAAAVLEG